MVSSCHPSSALSIYQCMKQTASAENENHAEGRENDGKNTDVQKGSIRQEQPDAGKPAHAEDTSFRKSFPSASGPVSMTEENPHAGENDNDENDPEQVFCPDKEYEGENLS